MVHKQRRMNQLINESLQEMIGVQSHPFIN